jgi:chemotaxis protein CheD
MTSSGARLRQVILKPGEIFVADAPCLVSTLLGSCVAVTLFAQCQRVGAICHALLPACRGAGLDCRELFRHVDCSVSGMLAAFRERGIPSAVIEAKLFGGADMFAGETYQNGKAGRGTVGRQNVARAKEILAVEGVRLVAIDVGGLQGRKILFRPHTGEVFLKRLDGGACREAWVDTSP